MLAKSKARRSGFSLMEFLVVAFIISVIAGAVVPNLPGWLSGRRLAAGVTVIQASIIAARDRARVVDSKFRSAGVQLVPSEQGGSEITRVVPLIYPPDYSEGRASVIAGFPAGFYPSYRRLVLEEALYDSDGMRQTPTSWSWCVRLGDRVTLAGHDYTVTGPMLVGPNDGNPDCFVNYGLAGTASPLNRGDGPAEWLELANRLDDNQDGLIDSGWNGIDDDLDGVADEDDEWEAERWHGLAVGGLVASSYRITRRPIAGVDDGKTLPPGIVVDTTGWDGSRLRSRLPVDRLTGKVDLLVSAAGSVTASSPYALAPEPLNGAWLHFWVAHHAEVLSPPGVKGEAKVVSVEARTGRMVSGEADASDPAETFRTQEAEAR